MCRGVHTVERVRAVGRETATSIRVEGTTDAQSVRDRLRAAALDCVVLDSATTDGATERIAEDATVPVVLYSDADPAILDDGLLATVDTLVEKGDPAESAPFLIEKIVGLVGEREEKSEYALARALARVDDDVTCEGHQFLVDDDGAVVWASDPFESVFPVEAVDGSVPTDVGFYDRLTGLLGDTPVRSRR